MLQIGNCWLLLFLLLGNKSCLTFPLFLLCCMQKRQPAHCTFMFLAICERCLRVRAGKRGGRWKKRWRSVGGSRCSPFGIFYMHEARKNKHCLCSTRRQCLRRICQCSQSVTLSVCVCMWCMCGCVCVYARYRLTVYITVALMCVCARAHTRSAGDAVGRQSQSRL